MPEDFASWYEDSHGYKPFPWQTKLADLIAFGNPPEAISVPTGAGKTVILAAWHWATMNNLPVATRLVYVVDRRLIVDSVTDYAETLGCKVVKMRGGVTIDDSWLMEPHKPAVIVSTVDQVGSRLLWRGYGVSSRVAPIHAALIGNDALIVLDEAHISTPFAATLEAVGQLKRNNGLPWQVVTMTATPEGDKETLDLSTDDKAHPILRKRLEGRKLARLVKVNRGGWVSRVVAEANALQELINGVVGVICNTTGAAREVFNRLQGEKVLLTGRVRPADKDTILEQYLPNIISGSRGNRDPLFVVATQTIEVGADLDFDALVTQNAPIDALRQRFGRLDRLGELGDSRAVIVHENLGANDECRVYGKALLKSTWSWLNKAQAGKGKDKAVDFGISSMNETIRNAPPPLRDATPTLPFTEENLRQLRQTVPAIPVDIAPWLHGEDTDNISVQVVWRADLTEDTGYWAEIVAAAPPVMAEAMPCPIYDVRRWLRDRPAVVGDEVVPGRMIQPGDLLVVPSSYGGYGPWGWEPSSNEPVEDIGNKVGAKIRLIGADENTDVEAALSAICIQVSRPVCVAYPAGIVVTDTKARARNREVRLEDHIAGVARVAEEITNIPEVHLAARFHDIGKEDPRFQVLLGARDDVLAKSSHATPYAAKLAREWSGLPEGWRHEIASLARLSDGDSDLLKYLVATHHGYSRAVMPLGGDMQIWKDAGGPSWGNMTERLNDEYGAWGLAYLEALVRLSDWIQSREEQSDAA